MNEERDAQLETLFTQSSQEPADDCFTNQVMNNVRRRRRNVHIVRITIVVMLVAFELLQSAPIGNSVDQLMKVLSTSIVDFDDGWLALLFSPLNSLAGLIGLLLLGLHSFYRKIAR